MRDFGPDRDAFKNEVGILTRLDRETDAHLVNLKLLLTMEIKGSPEDGIGFLPRVPARGEQPQAILAKQLPSSDWKIASHVGRWVARQLFGLTHALCKLHDLNKQEVGQNLDDTESCSDPFYGIHGGVKPENLLWYEDWVGPSPPSRARQ